MSQSVYAALDRVRKRQRVVFVGWATVYGLLAGSALGAVLAVGQLAGWWLLTPLAAVAAVAGGAALGCFLGLLVPRSLHAAAAAVDSSYRLKDRSTTALEFLKRSEATPLHQLQIEDAGRHLGLISPAEVVPVRREHVIRAAGVTTAACAVTALAAAVLFFWPRTPEAAASPAPAPENIVAAADAFKDKLAEYEEAVREENPELANLFKEMKQKVEELKKDGIDQPEALAKLSEMEASAQALKSQYNEMALADGALQATGGALSAAEALAGAGKALQDGKFEK